MSLYNQENQLMEIIDCVGNSLLECGEEKYYTTAVMWQWL